MLCFIHVRAVFYVTGDEDHLCLRGGGEKLFGQRDAVILAQLDIQQGDVGRRFLCCRLQGADRMKDADLEGTGEQLLHLGTQAGRKEGVVIADVNGVHVDRCPFLGMQPIITRM